MVVLVFSSDTTGDCLDSLIPEIREGYPGVKIAHIHDVAGPCERREKVDFFRARPATAGTLDHYVEAVQLVLASLPSADWVVRPHAGEMPGNLNPGLVFMGQEKWYAFRSSAWAQLLKAIREKGSQRFGPNELIATDGSVRDDLFFKRVVGRLKLPHEWHGKPPVHPLVAGLKKDWKSGRREPVATDCLKVEAAVVIADKGVYRDLERLIPTFMHFMPDHIPLYLVGDNVSITRAVAIAYECNSSERLVCREWLSDAAIEEAAGRLKNLTVQSDYWKPGPIWWKLEGLRRVIEEVQGGVLLLDSDIIFTAPFDELEFPGCDVVLSPFFWPDPELPVPPHGVKDDGRRVPIANRDGHINAGFILVGRLEIMDLWLRLYEEGIGGFYEQWIMKFLPCRFREAWFSWRHNWGSWRRQSPQPLTASLHLHLHINPVPPEIDGEPSTWHDECQIFANEKTDEARKALGAEPKDFWAVVEEAREAGKDKHFIIDR